MDFATFFRGNQMNTHDKIELPEPDSYLFQHEETGLTQYVDRQQVEWGFEKNNPRWQKISGAFTEKQVIAAIEADRQRRGEPVASIYITESGEREFDDWRVPLPVGSTELFAAPQPAEPVNSDRRMLLELMEAFDIETWQCPSCGHAEDTATMDSANTLRNYLQRSMGAEPAKVPSDDDLLAFGSDEQFFLFCDEEEFLDIARAVLARYSQK
jgi:hypothetical protein